MPPLEDPRRPELSTVAEHPTLLFRHDEPPFGQALIISGEHLYAFGCPRDGFDYLCKLARVPLERVRTFGVGILDGYHMEP